MKIAFYINNDTYSDVNFLEVLKGNPGVGGSEYLSVAVPAALSSKGNVDVVLFSNKPCVLSSTLEHIVCGNLRNALKMIQDRKFDYFVVDYKLVMDVAFSDYPDIKFLLWAHNFIQYNILNKLEKCSNVVKIINVGREQMDLFRDMPIFNKETFVYNLCPFNKDTSKHLLSLIPNKSRAHDVVYIGSLIPAKGVHVLAKAWPDIKRAVKDAQLYIIGSGRLYNHQSVLGQRNIAEKQYEDLIFKNLGNNINVLDSVHFLGVLGEEKNNVMAHCKVGVPNPTGDTETFGISAVEMQYWGCRVITQKCPGYLDSIYWQDGLYSNYKKLADYVIRALKDNSYDEKIAIKFVTTHFSIEVITTAWEKLLKNISNIQIPPVNNNYHQKHLKEAIRKIFPKLIRQYMIPIEVFHNRCYKIFEFFSNNK